MKGVSQGIVFPEWPPLDFNDLDAKRASMRRLRRASVIGFLVIWRLLVEGGGPARMVRRAPLVIRNLEASNLELEGSFSGSGPLHYQLIH
jgi:hypothetical protein